MQQSGQVSYLDLLNFFFKIPLPVSARKAQILAMSHAIMWKWNELLRPHEFSLSNRELARLSGVRSSNIGRYRENLLEAVKQDGVPLFFYKSRGKRRLGKYRINIEMVRLYQNSEEKLSTEFST